MRTENVFGPDGFRLVTTTKDGEAVSASLDLYRSRVHELAAFFWADGDLDAFEPVDFPSGGAVTAPGDGGTWAWVYPVTPPTSLDQVLPWAAQYGVTTLFVIVDGGPDSPASRLAGQAQQITELTVEVMETDGTTLTPPE